MKKFLTLVVLLATMTVAVQAQVKFGVKGGLNITSMKFDKSVADKSNQAGFFVGPTVKFTLPVVGLGVDASALYDQRSVEVAGDKIKQQSIQIPVNLRYGIGLEVVGDLLVGGVERVEGVRHQDNGLVVEGAGPFGLGRRVRGRGGVGAFFLPGALYQGGLPQALGDFARVGVDVVEFAVGAEEDRLGVVVVEEEVIHARGQLDAGLVAREIVDLVRGEFAVGVVRIAVHAHAGGGFVAHRAEGLDVPGIVPFDLPVHLPHDVHVDGGIHLNLHIDGFPQVQRRVDLARGEGQQQEVLG